MSRSEYSDDCDGWALIRWRGAVNSAIKGKRGQAFLAETLAALDALPAKRLVANDMEVAGEFCTLGAVAARRGKQPGALNDCDRDHIAREMGITEALAAEIMFENDCMDSWLTRADTPEIRWSRMRAWVASHITATDKE